MIGVREALRAEPAAGGAAPGRLREPVLSGALFSLGAAGIHFAVVPVHMQEYTLFGVALLAIALAQCALAAALTLAPSRRVALAGTVGNLAVVAVWAVSRTVGLPIGPHPGQPEAAGLSDVSASLLEVLAAAVLLTLVLAPAPVRRPPRLIRARTLWVVVVTLMLIVSGVMGAASEPPLGLDTSAPAAPGHAAVPMGSLREVPGDQAVRSSRLDAERRTIGGQEAWTFNGTVPGPELRVPEGGRLRVTLVNHLPAATAVHWHGLRLPNADDGVPGVTQDAVPPGGTYPYEFVVKDPGTYWYHTHQYAVDQLSRGLFGALVVEPRSGPAADRDYAVVLHALPSRGLEPGLLGFLPLFGTPPAAFNGRSGDLHLDARPGERVPLRVVGAVEGEPDGALRMNGIPEELVLLGTGYRVAALDGHELSGPQVIGPQRIRVGMGQRYDLTFTMPTTGAVRLADARGRETVTVGDGPLPKTPNLGRLASFDPSQYGTQAPDPVLAGPGFDAVYRAVPGNGAGFLDDQADFVHTINGRVSPMMPTFVVRTGQLVLLHIVNETDEFHSMHLHGHWLSVLAVDGQGIRGSPLHVDSVLVGPRESFDVAFRADNPGLWMFHCHVMLDAALGMSSMVVYQDVTTPYQVGRRSGNTPQ